MLSGSSLDSWALTRNPLDFAKSVASNVKVSTKNNKEMVEGLKQLSASELQAAAAARFTRVLSYI